MVVQYNIPKEVIEKFKERGKELAFLAGQKDKAGKVVTVSHLIFPIQLEFRADTEYGNYKIQNYMFIFLKFFLKSINIFAIIISIFG